MTGIATKNNNELEQAVDMLDGERGADVTGFEGKILSSILRLDTPEKIQEAAHRMNALSWCNAELQSAHQKNNLLSGISGADIDKMDIFNTIKRLERKKLRIMRFAEVKEKWEKPDQLLARQEILKQHTGLETVRALDILKLKKTWADLTKLLLVPEKDSFAQVSREALKETDSFIVNFWENKDVNNIIGAGDILPLTVRQVRLTTDKYPNGIVADRRDTPRPWYYNDSCKPPYIAVYDGDKIEITRIGEVDERAVEESTKADEEWMNHIGEEEIREETVRKISLEEKKGFIENATKVAKTIEEQYGIPWQVTVWQAALESGYGKSKLAANEGNYFGIKWEGKVFATREVYNGREVMEAASFRTYSDMKESFIDYAKFLTKNPRYRDAFQYAKNIDPRPSYYPKDYSAENFSPKKFIEAVKDAGYATDPIYVDKIASVWKTNDIEVA